MKSILCARFFWSGAVRGVLALALVSLLAACGTPVMKPEQASSVRRVGVVSLLPSELVYQKIGITVFNNERVTRPIGDAFNAVARRGAERALRQVGREVVQLDVDAPVLAQRVRRAAIIFDSEAETIEDVLLPLARQHQLDAIVLVTEIIDRDNGIAGVRMFFRAGMGEIRFAVAQPMVSTVIVDNRIKLLAQTYRPRGFAMDRPDGRPWSYKLEENLDAVTHARVFDRMQDAIESAVVENLLGMGF